MGYLEWAAIGAVLGMVQMAISLLRRPIFGGHPIQGFLTVAILGALIYGTILWLIFGR